MHLVRISVQKLLALLPLSLLLKVIKNLRIQHFHEFHLLQRDSMYEKNIAHGAICKLKQLLRTLAALSLAISAIFSWRILHSAVTDFKSSARFLAVGLTSIANVHRTQETILSFSLRKYTVAVM